MITKAIMAKLVLPRVQAMFVCDRVKESDIEPGVFSLAGARAYIEASSFPAFYPRLVVFAHMSGHQGEVLCHAAINRIETDEMIYETPSRRIAFEHPSFVVPVVFHVRNCVFPVPGVYCAQIFHEGKLIAERTLLLHEV
jgi:hypothetical protein